ncbi:MAG: cysteine desulfurase family protein [Pseudomonadota bacterium]
MADWRRKRSDALVKPRIYCDYNATSPLREKARQAMHDAMQVDGNPSSIHEAGRKSRRIIEDARKVIKDALGLPHYVIVFTSGATEALATVLQPGVSNAKSKRPTRRLLICETEHVAALEAHAIGDVARLRVDQDGIVDLQQLSNELSDPEMAAETLVCIHGANNETGVCQPLTAIETIVTDAGAIFISDLVQWIGRRPLGAASPDAIVISAHKLGGPAGVGALLYDPGRISIDRGLIRGGGQEKGVRAGTENRIGIAGFAAALVDAIELMPEEAERLKALRDRFEAQLSEAQSDLIVFGNAADRLPNTSCFALPGRKAATALMQLDLDGLAVSSGAACSSGKVRASHVLTAMGVEVDLADCALRISYGHLSQSVDAEQLIKSISRWS